ncbi:MAG: DUF1566 domain-containing protein, partial [Desulfamplus sp.]|nr:DUF1566 domain-containing protein [Desulfamplus sp.]
MPHTTYRLNWFIVFILLAFAQPAFSLMDPHMQSPIPDTGQTKDYTKTFGEDSDYNLNPMSFTKMDIAGNDLPDNAVEWAMVRDNVTGLVWEAKQAKDYTPDYSNIHDSDNTYTWYDPNPDTNGGVAGIDGGEINPDTLDFINALNTKRFGGFTDWRMPTKQELNSILNFGNSDPYKPSVNIEYFKNTMEGYYWTATTFAEEPDIAWKVDFYTGADNFHSKSDIGGSYHVRAVRG